ncbi:MAG: hypothetical protein TREMPRED_005054 [Tremellales sp. Tagirdzhanova-0007]|nr:MAG: hypothetical protein TREMPRED_005054 [Tremellales sp. Tagirdzhanova-0007]
MEALITRRGPAALARRICAPRELDDFNSLNPTMAEHVRFLSSRWTLKEAAYKSLSTYQLSTKLTWKSLHLRHLPTGAPILHLDQKSPSVDNPEGAGQTAAGVDGEQVELMASLSGDAGIVVGVVIAVRKG